MAIGQGIRRRAGGNSNMYEAGPAKGASLPTPEEALAAMAKQGSPRVPMGMSAVVANNASGAPSSNTTAVAKKNTQAGDPTAGGKGGARTPILAERLGARYTVQVKTSAPHMVEAAPTQANGRIVKSVMGSRPNFDSGNVDSF